MIPTVLAFGLGLGLISMPMLGVLNGLMNEMLWDNGVLAWGMLEVLHWLAGFWWMGCKLQVDNRQPTMWTTAGLAKGPWMEPGCTCTILWLMLVLVLTLFGTTTWYQLDWIIVVYIAFFAGVVRGHLYGTEDWFWKIGCRFWMRMEGRVCSKIPCVKCWVEIQPFHAKCWNTVVFKVESNKVFMVWRTFFVIMPTLTELPWPMAKLRHATSCFSNKKSGGTCCWVFETLARLFFECIAARNEGSGFF